MDDLLDQLSQLPRLQNYTAADIYQDYHRLFTSDEGKRVLRHILERGGVFNEPKLISPVDSHMLAAQRGKRQMALEILALVYNEPKAKPNKQTKEE